MSNTFSVSQQAKCTSWQGDICSGCYFVWFLPDFDKTLYSEVLPQSGLSPGVLRTSTYTDRAPRGVELTVPASSACMLLSREQWDVARTLGWPQTEPEIMRVFDLPAN